MASICIQWMWAEVSHNFWTPFECFPKETIHGMRCFGQSMFSINIRLYNCIQQLTSVVYIAGGIFERCWVRGWYTERFILLYSGSIRGDGGIHYDIRQHLKQIIIMSSQALLPLSEVWSHPLEHQLPWWITRNHQQLFKNTEWHCCFVWCNSQFVWNTNMKMNDVGCHYNSFTCIIGVSRGFWLMFLAFPIFVCKQRNIHSCSLSYKQ